MGRIWMCALLLGVVLGSAGGAWADSEADEAQRLYREGTQSYDLGEYERAIELYKQAYKHKEDPVFLYNIGQSFRFLKNFERAQFFYRAYLRNAPNAANRADVEKRIAEMAEMLRRQEQAATAPPTGTTPPAGSGPTTTRPEPSPPPGSATTAPGASSDTPPIKVPSPEVAAAQTDPGATGPVSPPADQPARNKPIYKKWWFWTGIVAVAAGATVIALTAGGSDGISNQPTTDYGTMKVF